MTAETTPRELAWPARFDRDPAWATRFARPLRWFAPGDPTPGPADRERCARAVLEVDEVGAALARAIEERRVSMKQFRTALEQGLEAVEAPAPELRAFFDAVTARPAWLDDARRERGARVCLRGRRASLLVLSCGSLMNGYRSSATSRQLAATGRLTVDGVAARVAETTRWWYEVVRPGGMAVGARGWQLTVHVRLMHALVNRRLEAGEGWDVAEWGRPINMADQASTLGLFSSTFLLQSRVLGRVITRADGADVMHLWRYVGHVLGIDPQWLVETEGEGLRDLYRFASFAPGPDELSEQLAAALATWWGQLHYRRFGALRRRLERPRMLGIQTLFSGRSGVGDLGLPFMPPWWLPFEWVGNLATSLPAAVLPAAERAEHRRGDRYLADWLRHNEVRPAHQ